MGGTEVFPGINCWVLGNWCMGSGGLNHGFWGPPSRVLGNYMVLADNLMGSGTFTDGFWEIDTWVLEDSFMGSGGFTHGFWGIHSWVLGDSFNSAWGLHCGIQDERGSQVWLDIGHLLWWVLDTQDPWASRFPGTFIHRFGGHPRTITSWRVLVIFCLGQCFRKTQQQNSTNLLSYFLFITINLYSFMVFSSYHPSLPVL